MDITLLALKLFKLLVIVCKKNWEEERINTWKERVKLTNMTCLNP